MRWIVLACLVGAGCFSKPELSGMTPPLSDGRDDRDGSPDGGEGDCPTDLSPRDSFDDPTGGCGAWATQSPTGTFTRASGKVEITAQMADAYCETEQAVDLTRGTFVELGEDFSAGMEGEQAYLEIDTNDGPVRIGVVLQEMQLNLQLTGPSGPIKVPYNPEHMKWWRLAPSVSGVIEGSYSNTGASWSPLGVQNASASTGTVRFGASSPAGQAMLILASFNVCPPPLP